MKLLKEITLTQFKNYTSDHFHFDHRITAIIGKNGTGKSNLLDAVYYLCFTKSYFHNKEIFNIQKGTNGFRISGRFIEQRSQDEQSIVCVWKDGKKTILSNNVEFERISDYIGTNCAIMIAPDDIKIINEGGEYRRKFFDGMIAQLEPRYLDTLLQYQKVLAQKNAYLKQNIAENRSKELIQIYNQQLQILGEEIVSKRSSITQQIIEYVGIFYHRLSSATENISITYTPNIPENDWSQTLTQIISREIDAGRILIGAHLDDWQFVLDDFQFKHQASQGQKKSLLIALKMVQLKLLIDSNKSPLLLLDDIFEKLDRARIVILFQMIDENNIQQVILSHTFAQDVIDIIQPIFPDIGLIELKK